MNAGIIKRVLKNTPKLQKEFIKDYYGRSNYKHYVEVLYDYAVKDETNNKGSNQSSN